MVCAQPEHSAVPPMDRWPSKPHQDGPTCRHTHQAQAPIRIRVETGASFLFAFVLCLGIATVFTQGQTLPFGKITDFQIPEFYPPPRENQLRALVRGAEAEAIGPAVFLIRRPTIHTVDPEGRTNLVLQAADCIYDANSRTAWSTNWIVATDGTGEITVSGRGFVWRQQDLTLIISNEVRSTVKTRQ